MPDGNDDPAQLDKATRLFQDALNVCSVSCIVKLGSVWINWYKVMVFIEIS